MKLNVKKFLEIIFSVLFWIGIWLILCYKVNNAFLLPSPKDVLLSTFELIKSAGFWAITFKTLGRILLGIIAAVVIGILTAVLSSSCSFVNTLISPLMSIVKATPVASFIFLAIIFMERNALPVFITALLVLPIMWTNILSGIRNVPKELREVSAVYKLPISKRVFHLYVPSIMPYFVAACRSALGMAWKAGVAAEVLCTPRSAIGTELYFAKTYLDTQMLFSWTLITIILSLIIEKVIIYLISRLANKTQRTSLSEEKA